MDVQLFVTCLIDSLFPETGEAVLEVLSRAGCTVRFNHAQTCCGQPAFNAGYWAEARPLAERTLEVFSANQDPLIVPSGSCAHMIRHGYPELFRDDPQIHAQAQSLAGRTFELTEFLVSIRSWTGLGQTAALQIAYHPSCHLLRGLGVQSEPLEILARSGYESVIQLSPECCGFGGVFAVEHASLSEQLLERRLTEIEKHDVDVVVGCDVSCLMNIEGALRRRGSEVRCMHIASLLAGREAGLR